MPSVEDAQDFTALLDYLKRNRGFDFTGYKQPSLMRRIQKRMVTVNVKTYTDYVDYLEVHPEEFTYLFNTILINVTGFFRDPAAWEVLEKRIIPRIVSLKDPEQPIRVWSTGCASGEEAYSVAILLAEALGNGKFREQVKIYATDVDEDALNKARLATYSEKDVEDLPEHLLKKYFTRVNGSYAFDKELRRNLIFGRNDLIQDAPISRIDLLICRNTMMYFNAETQAKILARFHFALNDNGFLFLGKAETLLTHSNIFAATDLKLRIFSKVPKVNLRDRLLIMAHSGSEEGVNNLFSLVRLRDTAFETSGQAMVIVDINNALVLANDLARTLFKLNLRDIGRPFQDLELSYRPVELRSSIQRAYIDHTQVLIKNVVWAPPGGEERFYDIRVQPLEDNGTNYLGVSITFTDITTETILQQQLENSNSELETAFEELQSTNEELETTNEELQSTIEELETTNEELQSTNEELETMNEELQSTNEELSTMNDELRLRTDELNQVNAFMSSILGSMRAGVAVLDQDMRIQVWNQKAEDLWGLRAYEVEGKNFLSLDIGLPVEKLKRLLLECLNGEGDCQEISLPARNRRGRDIACKVTSSTLLGINRNVMGLIVQMEEDGSKDGKT